jgi:hypothetical protein
MGFASGLNVEWADYAEFGRTINTPHGLHGFPQPVIRIFVEIAKQSRQLSVTRVVVERVALLVKPFLQEPARLFLHLRSRFWIRNAASLEEEGLSLLYFRPL